MFHAEEQTILYSAPTYPSKYVLLAVDSKTSAPSRLPCQCLINGCGRYLEAGASPVDLPPGFGAYLLARSVFSPFGAFVQMLRRNPIHLAFSNQSGERGMNRVFLQIRPRDTGFCTSLVLCGWVGGGVSDTSTEAPNSSLPRPLSCITRRDPSFSSHPLR